MDLSNYNCEIGEAKRRYTCFPINIGGLSPQPMSYHEEFQTVDLLVNSPATTRGVDAFAISLLKVDKQIRKLVTHLVFQFPCFGRTDVRSLREILVRNRRVYFEGFERGFEALYPRAIKELVGINHDRLHLRITEAIDHRNKIFHGQLTSKYLTRDDLLGYVTDIRAWCEALARGAQAELQYDGFGRNSYRKSLIPEVWKRLKLQLTDVASYGQFIRQHMERH